MMQRDMQSIVNRLGHKASTRCKLQPAQAAHHFIYYENNSCLCIISLGYKAKRLVNKACKPYLQCCLLLIFSITSLTTSARADCGNVKPLQADAFSPSSAQVLLQQMAQVCSSGAPGRWATLATNNVQTLLVKMPAVQRTTAYADYCSATSQIVAALGGQTSTGVHTLKIDSYATECGQKISTWYVHTAAGAPVLLLEVAKEGGLMKVSTR
jgi:hypothetical protein